MKRKIFSGLFALVLVLSLGLVTAMPAGAQEVEVVEEFQFSADGWVKWAPEEANTGDYSVLLGLVAPTDEARVAVPVSMAFAELTSLSYWYNIKTAALDTVPDAALKDSMEPDFTDFTSVPGYAAPYAVIELDTTGGTTADAWVVEARYADDGKGAWEQRTLGTSSYFHVAGGSVPAELVLPNIATLATIKAHAFLGTAEVLKVKVMMGDWHAYITNSPEAYVDDVVVNLVAYPLEPKAVVNIDAKYPVQGVAADDTSYDTIQDAIDDALPTQTILVAAGTYTENVVVHRGVTLKSAVKHAAVVVGVDVGVRTSWAWDVFRVIADGATVEGFHVRMYTPPGYPVMPSPWHGHDGIGVKASGVTVRDNKVEGPGPFTEAGPSAGWGISVIPDDAAPGSEPSPWQPVGNPGEELNGVIIEGNDISGTTGGGIWVSGFNCLVENNVVEDTQLTGILLPPWGSKYSHDNTIRGNVVINAGSTPGRVDDGVRIGGGSYSNTIEGNDVSGSSRDGIRTVLATGNIVHYNNIVGNTEFGVRNMDTATLDATLNWWGDISGPEHDAGFEVYPSNPGGIGDAVSDNVNYTPWLTRDFETVLADNIAYFGIPMVWLEKGWNILSTPIALDPACDTWGEYIELGNELAIDPLATTYYFDGQNQVYGQVLGTYVLKPSDAIYVKMAEPDIAAILFSPNVSVPSKKLYAGWNLVSLAWVPHTEVYGMQVDAALVSVAEVTGGLTGYVQVVSPPVNQYPWVYTGVEAQIGVPNWATWEGLEGWMMPTNGYWVFMLNDGTLAGFTFTPVSLQ